MTSESESGQIKTPQVDIELSAPQGLIGNLLELAISKLMAVVLAALAVFWVYSARSRLELVAALALFVGLVLLLLAINRIKSKIGKLSKSLETSSTAIAADGSEGGLIADLSVLDRRFALSLYNLRQALEQLEFEKQELIEKYEVLTENLAVAVVIRDSAGNVSYCSPYTEVLTGYPVSQIYESEQDFFIGIVHDDDKQAYSRALRVTSIGEPFQFRYRFYHRTGIEMWAETRTVPVLDREGELLFSLSITLDVTGTVRYQRQVEDKNRDMQDFTYMISHDMKAPIHTIKGMLHVLQEDLADSLPEDSQDTFKHLNQAADRLEQLTKAVVEYSRITGQETAFEAIKLSEVLTDVERDFQPQIKAAGATLSIEPNLPTVMGERLQLYQIFSNLIGNAIKYRSPERKLQIEVSLQPNHSFREVTLAVRDNGSGIPSDRLAHIFRPFHRAHGSNIEGSGIGLACVSKLLEKLGGSIQVDSELDQGSTFYVNLKQLSGKNTK